MSESTDVWYSIPDLNKTKNITDYQLSDLIKDGCCIRCMNNTCNNREPHGKEFPEQIIYFLNNPLRINIIRNAIKEAEIDINGHPLMFNLCHFIYTNKNCINCIEGRFKTIKIQDEEIKICHSDLRNIKSKLTVGLHIDLQFSISNRRININKVLPFDKENTHVRMIDDNYTRNNDKNDININDSISFPTMSDKKRVDYSTLDYSKIKNNQNKYSHEKPKQKYNKNYIKKDETCDNDADFSEDKYYDLIKENNYLKRKVYELEDELDKRYYDVKAIKNKIYDKFDTVEYLNNRVISQYFDTNLQDYLNSI